MIFDGFLSYFICCSQEQPVWEVWGYLSKGDQRAVQNMLSRHSIQMHFRALHILILRGQGNDTIITQAFDSLVSGRKISVNMLSNLQLIESDREIKERPKLYNRIRNIAGMYSI